MFGLGTTELLIIAVIIFLIFGAKRLPEIGKGIGGAIREFRKHVEFVKMDDETLIGFRKVAHEYLAEVKEKFPDVKRVLESQEEFKKEMSDWRDLRGRVAPWPYETYVKGRVTQ